VLSQRVSGGTDGKIVPLRRRRHSRGRAWLLPAVVVLSVVVLALAGALAYVIVSRPPAGHAPASLQAPEAGKELSTAWLALARQSDGLSGGQAAAALDHFAARVGAIHFPNADEGAARAVIADTVALSGDLTQGVGDTADLVRLDRDTRLLFAELGMAVPST
jgi:uncharacterized membrane protein